MNFKKLLTAVLAVGLVVWMAPLADAATVYVKPGGNDANNGLSWNTAKKTIQAGVDAAGYKGLVIVTNGTYVEHDDYCDEFQHHSQCQWRQFHYC